MRNHSSIALFLLAGAIAVNAETTPPTNPADAAFVQKAGQGGIGEIELSKLAQKSATSPDVRNFAAKIVDEHVQNNKDLTAIAVKQHLPVPQDPDREHAALRDKLATLKGAEFDKAYLDAVHSDQQKLSELLKSSETTVSAADLRAYIKKTQPVVEAHLKMAGDIKLE